jgi:hypothetical protein
MLKMDWQKSADSNCGYGNKEVGQYRVDNIVFTDSPKTSLIRRRTSRLRVNGIGFDSQKNSHIDETLNCINHNSSGIIQGRTWRQYNEAVRRMIKNFWDHCRFI